MQPIDTTRTASPALRILHLLVRFTFALVITFLLILALCVLSTELREILVATLGVGDPAKANTRILVAVILGLMVLVGVLSWLARRLPWLALFGIGLVIAAVLGYLVKDDPVVHRLQTIEEIIPLHPDAEASYAVLIRYGKRHPAGRDFKPLRLQWRAGTEKPEEWVKFVTAHRSEIEAEWEQLAPLRQWWTELNTFERITDLMTPHFDGELVAFQPVRALVQRGCAVATLHALDGNGDAAIETVLPLLEVARKLQETGRSLVLQMITIVVERMAMQTAGIVLERAAVSPAMRARLVTALSRPGGGEAGARRLVAVERVLAQNTILNSGIADAVGLEAEGAARLVLLVLVTIDPFIYNPRATVNLLGDFLSEAEDLVGRRMLKEYDDRSRRFQEHDARPRFKNLGGRLLAVSSIPGYGKVANSYWKVQDERAALLAKLGASPAVAP
jgi:hypothetical protein